MVGFLMQNQEHEEPKLKYLDFVHVAAMQAVVYLASLYSLAKENSGPLKPGVHTVEGTVKTVIGPVYDKFHDVPLELLKFVDRKVSKLLLPLPLTSSRCTLAMSVSFDPYPTSPVASGHRNPPICGDIPSLRIRPAHISVGPDESCAARRQSSFVLLDHVPSVPGLCDRSPTENFINPVGVLITYACEAPMAIGRHSRPILRRTAVPLARDEMN